MKLRTLCAAAMVAAIGAGLAVPVGASASTWTPPTELGGTTHEAISTGDVTVSAGSLDPKDPIVDPEKPGEEIIDPEDLLPGKDPIGGLGVTNVSPLVFGEINTGQYTINKPALAQDVHTLTVRVDGNGDPVLGADGELQYDKSATTIKRGAMVVFGDIRGGGGLGYTVQAELTKQFTFVGGTETLENSSVTFNNGIIETDPDNTTIAAEAGTLVPSFELSLPVMEAGTQVGGGAVDVVNAAVGTGNGVYTLEFGQSDNYLQTDANIATGGVAGTDDTAVVLNVPAKTAASMTTGNYQAEITWTIGSLA